MLLRAGFLSLTLAFTAPAYAENPNTDVECKALTFENIACVGSDLLAHFRSCQKTTRTSTHNLDGMLLTNTYTTQTVITFSRSLPEVNKMISMTTGQDMLIAASSFNGNTVDQEIFSTLQSELQEAQSYLASQPNTCGQKGIKFD